VCNLTSINVFCFSSPKPLARGVVLHRKAVVDRLREFLLFLFVSCRILGSSSTSYDLLRCFGSKRDACPRIVHIEDSLMRLYKSHVFSVFHTVGLLLLRRLFFVLFLSKNHSVCEFPSKAPGSLPFPKSRRNLITERESHAYPC